MLFSKANLQVVQVASKDGFDRALNGVLFDRDGSTVAGNGRVMVAVGPVHEETVHFPQKAADQIQPGEAGTVMPLDAVEKAMKYMPRDKRTSLEHVAMSRVSDPARIGFTSVNAKGDATTNASLPKPYPYPAWKETVKQVAGEEPLRICVNRSDIIGMLKTLEAACPDKGGINPVFLEIGTEGRGIVARCINFDTQQHAIGVVTVYKTGGQWLARDAWEETVFGKVMRVVKRIVRAVRVGRR